MNGEQNKRTLYSSHACHKTLSFSIDNNYFLYPFWHQSLYLCANFNSRHVHWCKIDVMETEAC